jgi:hypothetical protein
MKGYRYFLVMALCLILMSGCVVSLLQVLLELFYGVPVIWIYICFFGAQACYNAGHAIFALKYLETSRKLNYWHTE